jgi:RND family efflux transporter MFP subunit
VAKPIIRELVESKDFTGQFEAVDSVDVRARVSGYLESIDFIDGQIVKKGDLLFVIEPKPFELALESAKANLAEANANLDLAKAQLARTAELRTKSYATEETYDERVAQVNTATATRDAAIAAVDQAQLNLDYTRVTAPIAGRASRHELSVGNLVIGGTTGTPTLLTTIVSLDPIHIFFNVSEGDGMTYKRLVQRGEIPSARSNTVEIKAQLMDETEWPMKGTIDFVDNQYDRTTGTIRVRAAFPNPEYFITPGQFGRVKVPMSQLHPVMLVPDAAVVTDQSTKLLFTVAPDGIVVPRPVELGPVVDGNLRIIRSGITKDDEVIVTGLLRARPGQKVTPEQGTVEGAAVPKQP